MVYTRKTVLVRGGVDDSSSRHACKKAQDIRQPCRKCMAFWMHFQITESKVGCYADEDFPHDSLIMLKVGESRFQLVCDSWAVFSPPSRVGLR